MNKTDEKETVDTLNDSFLKKKKPIQCPIHLLRDTDESEVIMANVRSCGSKLPAPSIQSITGTE